jgi:hypothetical protein
LECAQVGWGTDRSGGPYWLIQNSWGADFGEGGYFRIRRGADESGIERAGLIAPEPAPLTQCRAARRCPARAVTLRDCTCRCLDGFAGPACDQCALRCANGGDRGGGCSKCTCPLGFRGPTCAWGVRFGPLASCAGAAAAAAAKLQADVSYGGGGGGPPPPAQSSFLGVFREGERSPYQALSKAYLCGGAYRARVNRGLCPGAGVRVSLGLPAQPGRYKVALVQFVPSDAGGGGLDGW